MKKIVLSITILSALSFNVLAQEGRRLNNEPNKLDDKPRKERPVPLHELNLTSEQENQIEALRETYRVKREELSNAFNQDLEQILTPEQRSSLQTIRNERPNRPDRKPEIADRKEHKRKKGPKEHKGSKGPKDRKKDSDKIDFQLDDETKSKFDALIRGYEEEKQQIENQDLSPDERQTKIDALRQKYEYERQSIINDIKENR